MQFSTFVGLGEPRDNSGRSGERKKGSDLKSAVNNEQRGERKEQASSSVPTGKGQTDMKSSTSLDASPATNSQEARNSRDVVHKGELS